MDEAKRGLKELKQYGMKKINFAGGEPFLYVKYM
jgi:radical S-adenosyl methionine domain-containing protein 2